MPQENKNSSMQECIDLCFDCQKVCLETIRHCLGMGGPHSEVTHIELMKNCAALCQVSGEFMISGSEFHRDVCALCADVCERCAESCERTAGSDAQMKECADLCRKCARECRSMGGSKSIGKTSAHETHAH